MSDTPDRLPSTGRKPVLSPSDVQRLLERYYAEDQPSMDELAEEFSRTDSKGETKKLSLATVRRYLKLAGIKLPRGRAAVKGKPRVGPAISTLMNRIPTPVLIGAGRAKLLVRLLDRDGYSIKGLAKEFGVSERRVRKVRSTLVETVETPEVTEAPVVEEPAVEEPVVEAPESPSEAE